MKYIIFIILFPILLMAQNSGIKKPIQYNPPQKTPTPVDVPPDQKKQVETHPYNPPQKTPTPVDVPPDQKKVETYPYNPNIVQNEPVNVSPDRPPDISYKDFSGGMNTTDGPFGLKPNQGTYCLNYDLDEEPGALTPRNGFTIAGRMIHGPNWGTITDAIYGHTYRSGKRELLAIGESNFGGWQRLLRSGLTSGRDPFIVDTTIAEYINRQSPWHFTSWRDNIIMSNGRQKPILWNGSYCRTLFMAAPGEVQVSVCNDPGNLDGYYRYAVTYNFFSDFGSHVSLRAASYISSPIYVHNGQLVLYNFPYPQNDSILQQDIGTYSDTCGLLIMIYRTKGNDFRPFYEAKWYQIGDIFQTIGDFKTATLPQFGSTHFIDNTGDNSLWYPIDQNWIGDTSVNKMAGYVSTHLHMPPRIRDPSHGLGSVKYMGSQDCYYFKYGLVNPDTLIGGDSVLYYMYMVTYYYSVNKIESDSGRSSAIYHRDLVNPGFGVNFNNQKYFKLEIPNLPSGATGLWRIIYKAIGYKHNYYGTPYTDIDIINRVQSRATTCEDYLAYCQGKYISNQVDSNGLFTIGKLNPNADCRCEGDDYLWYLMTHQSTDYIVMSTQERSVLNILSQEAQVTKFFPVGILKDASTNTFIDSMIWDSVIQRNAYYKSFPPSSDLNGITYFQDKLWGFSGSKLYYTLLDSIGYWSAMAYYSFDEDDGDRITALAVQRDNLLVFKNRNQYIVAPTGTGGYTLSRAYIENGSGCIAPKSIAWHDGNLIYLSENGLFLQSASEYMASSVNRVRISDAIQKTLDTIPMAAKRRSVGVVHKDEYWWSYNLDTLNQSTDRQYTLVYFFKTGGWSLYDYGFSDVTSFNPSTDVVNLSPPTDQWFIRGYGHYNYTRGETLLYKLDTGLYDYDSLTSTGTQTYSKIKTIWQSPYIWGNGQGIMPIKFGYLRYSNMMRISHWELNMVSDSLALYSNLIYEPDYQITDGFNDLLPNIFVNKSLVYWLINLPKPLICNKGFYWRVISNPNMANDNSRIASTIYNMDLWIDKYGYNIDH